MDDIHKDFENGIKEECVNAIKVNCEFLITSYTLLLNDNNTMLQMDGSFVA